MSEQLNLFPEEKRSYKIVHYFNGMVDTAGNEIFFVRTVKSSLTKYLAEECIKEMNKKIIPGSKEYFEIIESDKQFI